MALPTLDERTRTRCLESTIRHIFLDGPLEILKYHFLERTLQTVYLRITDVPVRLNEDQVLDHLKAMRNYASQFPFEPVAQAFCELSLAGIHSEIATRKREKAEALERHKRDSERAYKSAATRAANKAELEDRKTELENSLKTIGHVVKKAKV